MTLMVISTGGTIDKRYGVGAGVRDLSLQLNPMVNDILRRASSIADAIIVPLMAKDSLDIDDNDRATITAFCSAVPHERILITHGTDTMDKTAKSLASGNLPKTIVITGASQPAVMQGSDADFNVGFALSAALSAPHGVYVSMNAQLYRWDGFKKNASTGVFEPI